MKKLISLVLSALLVFSMTAVAYAAPSADDISYEIIMGDNEDGYAEQTVTVKGDAIAEASNKFVTLRIWKSGMSSSDYDDDPSARGDDIDLFAVLLQTTADNEGNFEFEFVFSEPSANYTADIKIQGEDIITITIPTADIESVNSFIDSINDAEDLATLTPSAFQPILDEPESYGINLTVFNRLTASGKSSVLSSVIDALCANNENGDSNTIKTVTEALAEATLTSIFEQTDDDETLLEALDVYESLLDIESAGAISDLYEGFGDKKGEVLSAMGKKSYSDVDHILSAFKETVFLKAISETRYYTDIEPIIDSNLSYIELDESYEDKYNESESVKKHVLKAINKQKYSIDSLTEFKKVFKDAVNSYGEEDKKSSGGGGGGGYSSNVTVDTSLVGVTAPVPTVAVYSDIGGHWAMPAITYLSNARVLAGRGDGTFDPDSPVTRAEYVKMIVVAYELYDEDATAKFSDVDAGSWYYPYVASMVERGYILGDSTGNFNPNALISRQDMAVILHRVLQGKNMLPVIETIELLFDDFDQVSPYAQNSIAYMSNMKLINGSDGKVRPHDSSTRAEAAQIIYNAVMEVGNK